MDKKTFLITLSDDASENAPCEFIKSIFENLKKLPTKSATLQQ